LLQATRRAGARCLAQLLEDCDLAAAPAPGMGQTVHLRERTIKTLFGPVRVRRRYFHDPLTGTGRCLLDERLHLWHGYSAGCVRLACRAAASSSFASAQQDLLVYAGVHMDARQLQRLVQQIGPKAQDWQAKEGVGEDPGTPEVMYVEADGTGIPCRPEALLGRPGKQPDGSARTREVKLGAIFTQQHLDPDNPQPWRDLGSSSYVATVEPAACFAVQLDHEARRRCVGQAKALVFIGDAASWVLETHRQHFPNATLIIDEYHAHEHLNRLVDVLIDDPQVAQAKRQRWRALLHRGHTSALMTQVKAFLPDDPEAAPEARREIAYFERHRPHMRYGYYRKQGWFTGSGVIEGACRTVVCQRLKHAGMHWSLPGAANVLALRTLLISDRLHHFWQDLHSARSAA
jgi:hypothetical protein